MNQDKTGGPAFPTLAVVGTSALSEGGLTVRDYFAAKAMEAIIIGNQAAAVALTIGSAKDAYAMADHMLAARENGGAS